MAAALIEAIPNVSEGRNTARLDRCAAAIAAGGATLLDRTADPSHHRAVFTFAGSSAATSASAIALANVAGAEIDLASHVGVHPRIGASDVSVRPLARHRWTTRSRSPRRRARHRRTLGSRCFSRRRGLTPELRGLGRYGSVSRWSCARRTAAGSRTTAGHVPRPRLTVGSPRAVRWCLDLVPTRADLRWRGTSRHHRTRAEDSPVSRATVWARAHRLCAVSMNLTTTHESMRRSIGGARRSHRAGADTPAARSRGCPVPPSTSSRVAPRLRRV